MRRDAIGPAVVLAGRGSRRDVRLPPEGRGEQLPSCNGENPRLNPGRIRRGHPGRSFPRNCSRPSSLFTAWTSGPARRRCALEAFGRVKPARSVMPRLRHDDDGLRACRQARIALDTDSDGKCYLLKVDGRPRHNHLSFGLGYHWLLCRQRVYCAARCAVAGTDGEGRLGDGGHLLARFVVRRHGRCDGAALSRAGPG
jgi:hypothetical protein